MMMLLKTSPETEPVRLPAYRTVAGTRLADPLVHSRSAVMRERLSSTDARMGE